MRSDIIDRVIDVIRSSVDDRRRLKELEEETGIPSGSWKNVWSRKQRPTAHMIEAIARRWPQYAFWLVTGITDETNGHTAPRGIWTCGQERARKEIEEAAKKYFDLKIYVQDSVYGMSGAAESNYVVKKNPTDEELAEAKQNTPNSDDPEVQELMDLFFGTEVKVYQKKYSDLDYAIARIAFEKRLNTLKQHFFDFWNEPENYHRYLRTLRAVQEERIKKAKEKQDDDQTS